MMNKKQILSVCLLLVTTAGAAHANGGITAAMLFSLLAALLFKPGDKR